MKLEDWHASPRRTKVWNDMRKRVRKKVLVLLADTEVEMTRFGIAEEIDESEHLVSIVLREMVDKGEIVQLTKIVLKRAQYNTYGVVK